MNFSSIPGISRRDWLATVGAGTASLAGVLPLSVRAQSYPGKPVRLIVTVSAGGATDALARFVAEALGKSWNTTFIVDNRSAAGGLVGTEAVAKAAPDGYTLLFTYANHYSQPWAMAVTYDPLKDFIPLARVASTPLLMATRSDSPLRNVADVIATAKQKPGQLTYGSAGIGTPGHMCGALFTQMTGTQMRHVPYKGAGQVPVDAASGQVDLMFGGGASALPLIRAGRLRVLAVTGSRRSASFPEAPTIAESGVAGYEVSSPIWVMAPRGTPPDITGKLSEALVKIASTPEFRDHCISLSADADVQTMAQSIAGAPGELAKWKTLVELAKPSSD